MAEFIPLIINSGNPRPPRERMQAEADRLGVTHVRSNSGQVQKLVKIGTATVKIQVQGKAPQRWVWSRVGALGTLAER